MRWLKAELLATCLVFGCGSAMGGPSHDQGAYQGQGTYQGPPGEYQNPQSSWQENQPNEQDQTPQAQQGQEENQQQPSENQQGTYEDQQNQAQQDQQNQQGQQGSDTVVESFEWASGGTHLGIVVEGMTRDLRSYFGAPSDRGVLIAHVVHGSPAERAGLRVGDVLLDVGNQSIRSADDVISALAQQPNGQVRIDVMRQGRRMRLSAYLGNPQQNEQQPQSTPML